MKPYCPLSPLSRLYALTSPRSPLLCAGVSLRLLRHATRSIYGPELGRVAQNPLERVRLQISSFYVTDDYGCPYACQADQGAREGSQGSAHAALGMPGGCTFQRRVPEGSKGWSWVRAARASFAPWWPGRPQHWSRAERATLPRTIVETSVM